MLKKLMRKLRGTREDEPNTGQSSAGSQHRERAARVQVSDLADISFLRTDLARPARLIINNVSTSGIGFFNDPDDKIPGAGAELSGELTISGKAFPCTVQVAHVSPGVVGCSFRSNVADLAKALSKYFVYEIEGLGLTEVPKEMLNKEPDGTLRWFTGKNSCELTYVENAGKVIRFTLMFFGNYLEGSVKEGIRFGVVSSDERSGPRQVKGSNLVYWADRWSDDMMVGVQRFLDRIPRLDRDHARQIITLIFSAAQKAPRQQQG